MRSLLAVTITLLSMASAQPVVAAETPAPTITSTDRDRRLMELFDKKAELEKQKAEAEADIRRHMPEFKDEQDIDRVITGPGRSAKPGELDHIPWTSGPQSIKKEQIDAAIKRKTDVEAALKALEKQIDVVTYTPVSDPPEPPKPMTPAVAPTTDPALPKSEAKSPAAGGSPFDDIQEIIAQSKCDALRSEYFKTAYRRVELEDEIYGPYPLSAERRKEIHNALDAMEPEIRRAKQKLQDEGCIPAPAPQKEAAPAQPAPQGAPAAPAPGAVAVLPKPPGPRAPQRPDKTKAVQEADTSAKSEPLQGDDCDTLVKQIWAADADIIRYSREIREANRDVDAADLKHKTATESAQKAYDECRSANANWIGCRIEASRPVVAAWNERTGAAQRGMDAVEGYRSARESLNQSKQAYADKKCKSGDGGTPEAGRRPPAGPTQASLAPPSLLPPPIVDITPPQRGPAPPQQSGPTLPPPKLPPPAGAKPPQAASAPQTASAPSCPDGFTRIECLKDGNSPIDTCMSPQQYRDTVQAGWKCARKGPATPLVCRDPYAATREARERRQAGASPGQGYQLTCDKSTDGCDTNCRWVATETKSLKAAAAPALLPPPALLAPVTLPTPHATPALLPPPLLPPVVVGPSAHTQSPAQPTHAKPAKQPKPRVVRPARRAPAHDPYEAERNAAATAALIGIIGTAIIGSGSGYARPVPTPSGGHVRHR